MAKRFYINIEKVEDKAEYKIYKNVHLEFLVRGCCEIYSKLRNQLENEYGERYIEKPEFIELMQKLLNGTRTVVIDERDLVWLYDWIDVIVNIIIEIDNVDFKDKYMKRFLKTAENFISEIKTHDLKIKDIKKW